MAAFCRAEVRLEACCPGGETEVWRVEMSKGMDWPLIVYASAGEDGKRGKGWMLLSTSSVSTSVVEPRYSAGSAGFRAHEMGSFARLGGLREKDEVVPKPTGMLLEATGMLLGVEAPVEEAWSRSLIDGE